ncbi:TPA: sugar phosphate isomerase/epimerase [Candidatus Poribacteria bacterium]|nr:sugar phosphate isomerase/epimerase [Candidatus Poribacteria bacterium]
MNKIGLNIDSRRIDGDLELLRRDLALIKEQGFDVVEIPVNGLDAIVNGTLRRKQVERIKAVLDQFELEYAVHAPNSLNLRDFRYPETHRKVFEACIQFTANIGAEKLIYHQGRLIRWVEEVEEHSITEEEAREIEVEELFELGKMAESEGVLICIENVHSSITHLVRLVRDVGLKSVGITYDFGHSYINSKRIGYDFIKSIHLAKPFIYHTHVNDNFGKGEAEVRVPYIEGMPMGIGDLHLPIGWGAIPYEEVFKAMEGYKGVYVIELDRRFFEDISVVAEEALKNLKGLLKKITVKV